MNRLEEFGIYVLTQDTAGQVAANTQAIGAIGERVEEIEEQWS